MLRSEFEKLTGIYPSENLFEVIQEAYTHSGLSERDFCNRYKLNADGIAKEIQCEADSRACQMSFLYGEVLGKADRKAEQLQKELDELKSKKTVKILCEILRKAGEISIEDFNVIMKQCEIQP